jgi:hypothetical protein
MASVTPTAERVASNEALFMRANDTIAHVATELDPLPFVPFLCECPTARCTAVARLTLGEYLALRLFADRYLISPHCAGGERAETLVVERHERYAIVDRIAPG